MGEDPVEGAVGVDELGRGLLAHPRHSRQVVGRIATQGRVGHVVGRPDSCPFDDPRLVVQHVVGYAPAVVEDLHVGVLDELIAIAIPGDDDDVAPRVAGLGGERGDDVVGFETRQLHRRDVQGCDHLPHEAELLRQQVRRLLAVAFVGGHPLVAEGRLWPVEHHRDRLGIMVPQEVDQHRCEAVDGVGHLARSGGEICRQREEGAVGERVAVDQENGHHIDAMANRCQPYRPYRPCCSGRSYSGAARSLPGCAPGTAMVPSRTSLATSIIVRRSRIAVFCMNENAACSVR